MRIDTGPDLLKYPPGSHHPACLTATWGPAAWRKAWWGNCVSYNDQAIFLPACNKEWHLGCRIVLRQEESCFYSVLPEEVLGPLLCVDERVVLLRAVGLSDQQIGDLNYILAASGGALTKAGLRAGLLCALTEWHTMTCTLWRTRIHTTCSHWEYNQESRLQISGCACFARFHNHLVSALEEAGLVVTILAVDPSLLPLRPLPTSTFPYSAGVPGVSPDCHAFPQPFAMRVLGVPPSCAGFPSPFPSSCTLHPPAFHGDFSFMLSCLHRPCSSTNSPFLLTLSTKLLNNML